jgi:hypothetical protein
LLLLLLRQKPDNSMDEMDIDVLQVSFNSQTM